MKEPSLEGLKNKGINNTTQEGKVLHPPEILDGKGAKDLLESARYYQLASGDDVVAGTDKGINYKDHNEDRIAIFPAENFIAVVDGMGGRSGGELAAEILSKNLLASPRDIDLAIVKARQEMEGKLTDKHGGAVLGSARIFIEEQPDGSLIKFLDIFQLGDVKIMIIKQDGTIGFESKDQSLVQKLIEDGTITPDEALYHPFRHIVSNTVSPDPKHEKDKAKFYPNIKVEKGDVVIIGSDCLDNFTAEEIAREKRKQNLSPRELFSWLSSAMNKRMRDKDQIIETSNRREDGVYIDGYKSEPKPDNEALVFIEIQKAV